MKRSLMTEAEFWGVMERRICLELRGMADPALRRLWCDGVLGEGIESVGNAFAMVGTIWIGVDGQTPMRFKMSVPKSASSIAELDFDALVPAVEATGWLLIDQVAGRVKIDMSKAEVVEPMKPTVVRN